MKYCENCGEERRAGRKYCKECRNSGGGGSGAKPENHRMNVIIASFMFPVMTTIICKVEGISLWNIWNIGAWILCIFILSTLFKQYGWKKNDIVVSEASAERTEEINNE